MRLCTKNNMLDVRGEEYFSFYDYKLAAVAVCTSLQQYWYLPLPFLCRALHFYFGIVSHQCTYLLNFHVTSI